MRTIGVRSKKGITLVELIAAMALTMFFAVACIMLIVPVSMIYTHTLHENRAQLVADSVVDALRAECSKAIISSSGDVWIAEPGAEYDGKVFTPSTVKANEGSVLVFRRNSNFCETIASNYTVSNDLYNAVRDRDESFSESGELSGTNFGRSVYTMDDLDKEKDQVHFGYFYSNAETVKDLTYPYPFEYYDYTNPFTHVAYLDYKVELNFHNIGYNETTLKPAYVICDVTILNNEDEPVYTRSAALCF